MKHIYSTPFKGIYSVISRERRLHRGKVCPMCILNRYFYNRKHASVIEKAINLAMINYIEFLNPSSGVTPKEGKSRSL